MTPLLLATVLILITLIVIRTLKEKRNENYPPGPIRLPFIGSYLQLLWMDFNRPYIALTRLKEIYDSPVISFGMGGFNAVVASNYATIKELFNHPNLQGRLPAFPGLVRTYGENNGLFGDDGPRWLHIRRQTLSAMRDLGFGRRSEEFEAIQLEEVQTLVNSLSDTNGRAVLVPDAFFYTFLNIINHVLHGFRYPATDKETLTKLGTVGIELVTGVNATGQLIAVWPWIRFLFPQISGYNDLKYTADNLQNYVTKSYNSHKSNFDDADDTTRDLIEFFLQNKSKYPDWTDEEILSIVIDLTFPNVAATATVTFTLIDLIQNPEYMKKCQEEIDCVVGRGRLPNLNDRQYLLMVEACIRETLRLRPLIPLGAPHRATEDCTLAGYFVPKDSLLLANLYAMNRDPKSWEHPNNYNPERFIKNGSIRDTTFPFGLGKRVCAGETYVRQNMFLAVAGMIQNFNIELATPVKEENFRCGGAVAPNPDLSMTFTPRG